MARAGKPQIILQYLFPCITQNELYIGQCKVCVVDSCYPFVQFSNVHPFH